MSCRVHVFCADPWHPAATVRQGLTPLAAEGFQFKYFEDGTVTPAIAAAGPALTILARANLVPGSTLTPWLTPESEPDWYPQHGLVAVHSGISRYDQLPLMNQLLGATFVRHPEPCAVTLQPIAGHPLTAGIEPFTVHDEHYFIALNDDRSEVFLHSHSVHGIQPAGWTRSVGTMRVCILTPGHFPEIWRHPSFQILLTRALYWAAEQN